MRGTKIASAIPVTASSAAKPMPSFFHGIGGTYASRGGTHRCSHAPMISRTFALRCVECSGLCHASFKITMARSDAHMSLAR